MKISFINYNGYYAGGSFSKQNKRAMSCPLGVNSPQNLQSTHITSLINNIASESLSDSVSFKGKLPEIYINDMRELPDLTCGCCGKKMLQNKKLNNFLNKKIYYPASISLKRIKTEQYFKESSASDEMKEAYAYLKNYANLHPNLTMSDILSKREVKSKRQSLSQGVSDAFDGLREMTKLVAHDSKYMIDEMSKLNLDFHKLEKRVFKELQRLSKEYPNETFYNILNKPEINHHYLKNLQIKQLLILDKVEFAAENAPPDIKRIILDKTEKARAIFKEESREIFHKRGRVISSYKDALASNKNNPIVQEVFSIIDQLPDSKTDLDAFMIKSAQKSSNAIIEILLGRQRNTYEHVKPHHREGDNGESHINNYIALCGKCNGERQRTEYDIFIQKHPEMIKNEQIQINKIIYYINNGRLIGHDNYPKEIQKALDTESKGGIEIDISSLDLKKAKINRALRQERYIAKKKQEEKTPKIYKFGKGILTKKIQNNENTSNKPA